MTGPGGAGKSFGPYTIEGEIARGGQGAVMRARHTASGEPVALKLLLDRTPKRRKRFLQEAAVLSKLSHPNLLRVTDHGEHNGLVFMAMEFVEGRDLKTILAQGGIPEYAWTARVLGEVAGALEHCHQQGVVHRDVKPANVLIETGSGRTVLVDFGMLKRDPQRLGVSILDDGTRFSQTGELKGTPTFMAPEQVNPQKFGDVSPRTDVYALGATLYLLLTDRLPHDAPSLAALLAQILGADPDPPTAHNPRAPRHLSELALHCLAKDPARRPASAAEFARLLKAEEAGGSFTTRPSASRALLGASVVLNLGLLGGLGLLLAERQAGPDLETRWERAISPEGDADALLGLEQALGDDERAQWLPALYARWELRQELGDPQAAVEGLPPDQAALLVADHLVQRGPLDDLEPTFAALEASKGAHLICAPPPPAVAVAFAERLEEELESAREPLRTSLVHGAARAWLLVPALEETSASDAVSDLERLPLASLARIERAFDLDAYEAAHHAEAVADLLLHSAAAVLSGPADPTRCDLYARAREWLILYRMIRPLQPIPGDVLDDLQRVGTSESALLQQAALPGSGQWTGRTQALFAALYGALAPDHPLAGSGNAAPQGLPQPWREWVERARAQNPSLTRQMFQEWLLWRPDATLLWVKLGDLEEKAGAGREAWGALAFKAALPLERVDRARTLYLLGRCLSKLERYEAADEHLREAIRLGGSYDDGNAQWAGLQLAWNLYHQGRHAEALATLDDMRRVWMGGRGTYWRLRIAVLVALGRDDEAQEARQTHRRLVESGG